MSSSITTFNPQAATLLEMRSDPKRFPRLNTIPVEQKLKQGVYIVRLTFDGKLTKSVKMAVK